MREESNMFIEKVRIIFKKSFKRRSFFYRFFRNIYYKFKILLDFIIFKYKYKNCLWYYKFEKDKESYSQYGQDRFLLSLQCDGKTYVEIGANHPIRLNNTFLLEKNGWKGISIDALKKYSEDWKKYRSQKFINCAIGNANESKEYIEFYGNELWYDMMSGFKDYIREEDINSLNFKKYIVDVKPLCDVIDFETFDMLLIDAEGAEKKILEGANLEKYRPKYIMLENAKKIGGDDELRKYMKSLGYEIKARIGCTDEIYELLPESMKV